MPRTSAGVRSDMSPLSAPAHPFLTPVTWCPSWKARRATPRIAALSPGASPPPVRIPIRIPRTGYGVPGGRCAPELAISSTSPEDASVADPPGDPLGVEVLQQGEHRAPAGAHAVSQRGHGDGAGCGDHLADQLHGGLVG